MRPIAKRNRILAQDGIVDLVENFDDQGTVRIAVRGSCQRFRAARLVAWVV